METEEMRILAYWFAFLCRKLALLFGKLGLRLESWYYELTEERRA